MSEANDKPSLEQLKKRPIRSFVVRSGRMTLGQQKGWEEYWSKYGMESVSEQLDWSDVFGNDNPVVFEIGFGMGQSLFEMASSDPHTNFVGVEVHRPGVGALLSMAGEAELENLRVFCCDANEIINHMLKDGCLARLQLYFPDPWHKKRHHKRRLVQDEFVARIIPKLAPDGVIHMATDWEPYAEHMLEVLEASQDLINEAGQGQYSPKPDYRPNTKFEKRGERLGHGVWDLLYRRCR